MCLATEKVGTFQTGPSVREPESETFITLTQLSAGGLDAGGREIFIHTCVNTLWSIK